MAFSQRWHFSEGVVGLDKNEAGAYEFGNDSGAVIYIGSTNDIKRRLLEHLGEDAKSCIKKNAAQYRIEYRSDYKTAEKAYYDEFVRLNGKKPQCNEISP